MQSSFIRSILVRYYYYRFTMQFVVTDIFAESLVVTDSQCFDLNAALVISDVHSH